MHGRTGATTCTILPRNYSLMSRPQRCCFLPRPADLWTHNLNRRFGQERQVRLGPAPDRSCVTAMCLLEISL